MRDAVQGDRMAITKHLNKFKANGLIRFEKVMMLPSSERIPALAKTEDGRDEVLVALTAALKSAFNNFNLKFAMNADQVIELADQIIDQSFEDNLSIEDVLLFLQGLLTSKYGKVYDRMDIPLFFEFFEKYRQERHNQLRSVRDEERAQSKSAGRNDMPGMEVDRNLDTPTFFELLRTYHGTDEDME
jgi:hypothetical protein